MPESAPRNVSILASETRKSPRNENCFIDGGDGGGRNKVGGVSVCPGAVRGGGVKGRGGVPVQIPFYYREPKQGSA